MSESKRLFLACWPDQSLQETLYRLARRFQREHGGRRTARENIHLTLVFLGQVHREKEMELRYRLRNTESAAFELVINKAGAFPGASVCWVGPAVQPKGLKELYGLLRLTTHELGFHTDDKPFVPHITLLRKSRAMVSHDIKPVAWRVGSFYLIESVQTRAGVEYRIVEEFVLTDKATGENT
jgi:2'-5' RNA ligase